MSDHPDWSPHTARDYAVHERLLDGRGVLIRAIRPEDKRELQDGLRRQSPESAYFRFMGPKRELSEQELAYFTEVDFEDHVALGVVLQDADRDVPIGVGRYIVFERDPERVAEIAFAVDDAYHGLGVATLLLRHLVEIARASGVRELRASVLSSNLKMLEVFFHSGLRQEHRRSHDVIEFRFPL